MAEHDEYDPQPEVERIYREASDLSEKSYPITVNAYGVGFIAGVLLNQVKVDRKQVEEDNVPSRKRENLRSRVDEGILRIVSDRLNSALFEQATNLQTFECEGNVSLELSASERDVIGTFGLETYRSGRIRKPHMARYATGYLQMDKALTDCNARANPVLRRVYFLHLFGRPT